MTKWVCSICGFVHTGDTPPQKCPVCGAPALKFKKQEENENDLKNKLSDCLKNESREITEYLAISEIADKEEKTEIAEIFRKLSFEKAENTSKIAELLKKYF